MSESITSRVSRLVSGGFNAVIDAMENASPEIVMQQSIRELDQAMDEIRSELGQVLAGKHLASKRLMEESDRHEKLGEQIQLAVQQQRDDLASVAIARQMDIEAQIPVLENAVADAADRERELEGFIAALQAKQREMQAELERYRSAQNSAKNEQQSGPHGQVQSRADKASAAFNRAISASQSVPSHLRGNAQDEAKLAELDKLARDNRIQERLAALKAKGDS